MLMRLCVCFILEMLLANYCFARELMLEKNKVYLLNFNEEIQNMHFGGSWIDAQILHTINDGQKQIILSLKADKDGVLQVKTQNHLYNYEIKSTTKSSNELLQIDFPPVENLNVDIYTGD